LRLRKKASLTRSTTCSGTDGRPECPSLITDASFLNEIVVPLQNGLVVGESTLNLRLKARRTVTTLFVLANSNTHRLLCCGVSAILDFTALWRWEEYTEIVRERKEMF
jgi:hypothetical protein